MRKKKEIGDDAYLWTLVDNSKMVFWASDTTQQYLTPPSELMPREIVKTGGCGKITQPKETRQNILARHGIISAAFSQKTAKSHHYFSKSPYSILTYVLSGRVSFNSGEYKFNAKKGECLVVPSDCVGHLQIDTSVANMFWLHIDEKAPINAYLGRKIFVKTPTYFLETAMAMRLFKEEVYLENRSALILENLADILSILLAREFSKKTQTADADSIADYISEIKSDTSQKTSTALAALRFSISAHAIDKICMHNYGKKFSKLVLDIRMKKAVQLLKSGESSCAEIGRIVGYDSVFSFSRAFKKYYGKSPANFPREEI